MKNKTIAPGTTYCQNVLYKEDDGRYTSRIARPMFATNPAIARPELETLSNQLRLRHDLYTNGKYWIGRKNAPSIPNSYYTTNGTFIKGELSHELFSRKRVPGLKKYYFFIGIAQSNPIKSLFGNWSDSTYLVHHINPINYKDSVLYHPTIDENDWVWIGGRSALLTVASEIAQGQEKTIGSISVSKSTNIKRSVICKVYFRHNDNFAISQGYPAPSSRIGRQEIVICPAENANINEGSCYSCYMTDDLFKMIKDFYTER